MPELPEVEAARRAIEDHCIGKKIIKSIIADDSKVIDGVSPKDFEASLNGKTIIAAHRKGKNMWLQLDSPPFPSFQFGMTGAVYIKGVAVTKYKGSYIAMVQTKIAMWKQKMDSLSEERHCNWRSAVKDTDEWPSKYSKFFIELHNGLELSFTDKRRFAKVRLLDNPVAVPPISELGSDALLEPMTVDEFYSKLQKKNIGIKALLLDQGFISGIGNWIADEVLYQASIHPLQISSSMSKEHCRILLSTINEVISKAVDVGAESSQFPSNWIFHFRENKPGKAFIDGKKIEFITAGGRTTAYVPDVQKLNGAQAAKASKSSAKRTKESNGDGVVALESEQVKDKSTEVVGGKKTTDKSTSLKQKFRGSSVVCNDDDNDNGSDDEDLKGTESKKPPRNKAKGKKNKDTEGKKTKTAAKNVPRKRKPLESDDSAEDENEEEDENYEDQKHAGEAKVEKTSRKKPVSRQKAKQIKRKTN